MPSAMHSYTIKSSYINQSDVSIALVTAAIDFQSACPHPIFNASCRRESSVAGETAIVLVAQPSQPYRWSSNTMRPEEQPSARQWNMPSFSCNHADSYHMENEYINENLRNSSCFKASRQNSTPVSSLCHEPEAEKVGVQCNTMLEEEMEQDEVTSSYVIENNSNHRGELAKQFLLMKQLHGLRRIPVTIFWQTA
ncbi:hypothetical protein H0E87_031627 [Populus deltoides]|uniref:Uncharacterized protein n=1 Tax=Populus deltoides TaxID=3696 RepID=A0A8T2WG60_POPDE|nr:hypothetical protein H0E87_031627 [Populus deltoides]